MTVREFRVLGPVEVIDDGQPVAVGGPRQRAVLVVLALNAGRLCSVEQLIDAVWGERPPPAAVKTVRGYVSRLRAVLGDDTVLSDSGGYRLDVGDGIVDVERFTELLADGRKALDDGAAIRAERSFGEALGEWRGEVLGQGADLEGLGAEAGQLEELRLTASEHRMDAWLKLGRDEDVAVAAERLVEAHPMREGLWAALMLALYRLGRQADALAAYHRARRVLSEELGLEPGPALRDLQARILRQDIASGPLAAGAVGNLPAPVTSFVGRASELATLGALLDEARLVTLVGVGGAGKTRLAIEVAGCHRDEQGVPAWFVDLAPVAEERLILTTVMAALGVSERPDLPPIAALVARLSATRTLMLVDNCEHLLDACAELVLTLLESCPRLIVLATSRQSLGIAGETTYTVPPLATPDSHTPAWRPELLAGYDAVRLFLERGRAVTPTVPIPTAELDTVAAVCRQLDGLPLAIEFAAARLRSMSVGDIAAGMSDRFALLSAGHRIGSARHITLRAAIDWSHELLEPDDQVLLRRLSIFAGGFTADAVSAVCSQGIASAAIDGLDRLVGASMIVAEADRESVRFRLDETVREYTSQRLDDAHERAVVAERHASYFLTVAEHADANLIGPEERRWFTHLATEHDNLRAALHWAAETDPVLLGRLATALGMFWRLQGNHNEGSGWLQRALESAPDGSSSRAGLVIWLGNIRWRQSEYDQARELLSEGVALARSLGDQPLLGVGLQGLASAHKTQGQYDQALPLHAEAAAVRESIGDLAGAAMSLGSIAEIASWQGRHEEAAAGDERGLAMMRAADTQAGIVAYLHSMAELAFVTNDTDRAGALALEALSLAEEIGEAWHIALIHDVLAWVTRARGDPDSCAFHATLALRQFCDLEEIAGVADALDTLGGVALDRGQPDRAALLLLGAHNIRETRGIQIRQMLRARRDIDLANAAELVGPRIDSIRQRARTLEFDELVELARDTRAAAER
ncbi:MAG: BTAD domain-containing putative transcriptional regulator [Solirubrobacteraceae bacterium]